MYVDIRVTLVVITSSLLLCFRSRPSPIRVMSSESSYHESKPGAATKQKKVQALQEKVELLDILQSSFLLSTGNKNIHSERLFLF